MALTSVSNGPTGQISSARALPANRHTRRSHPFPQYSQSVTILLAMRRLSSQTVDELASANANKENRYETHVPCYVGCAGGYCRRHQSGAQRRARSADVDRNRVCISGGSHQSASQAKTRGYISQSGCWVVAEDTQASTVWLLTPPGHPAYPSLVKRTLVNSADGAYFETNVRCFASQEVCDKFFGSSQKL